MQRNAFPTLLAICMNVHPDVHLHVHLHRRTHVPRHQFTSAPGPIGAEGMEAVQRTGPATGMVDA